MDLAPGHPDGTALVLLLLLALAAILARIILQEGVDSGKTSNWQSGTTRS